MSNPAENSDELLELLGAAWDGRLESDSFARLESLLSSSEQARDALVAFSQFQSDLVWIAASSQAHEKAISTLAPYFESQSPAPRQGARSSSAVVREGNPQPRQSGAWSQEKLRDYRLPKRGLVAVAVGAAVLVALFASLRNDQGSQSDLIAESGVRLLRPPHNVARIASIDSAAWSDGANHRPEELLAQGVRLRLTRGMAQISMACGADVVLEAPCTVELVADDCVRLEAGKLSAQAADWAKGFTVETECLRITDLGTRFGVSVESSGIEEVHVLEGLVRAQGKAAPQATARQPLLLRAGQGARTSRSRRLLDTIPANSAAFAKLISPFRPLHPIDIANTGLQLPVGSRDPRWRITAGHASGGLIPAQAMVCRPHVYYLENAPEKWRSGDLRRASQWISVPGGTTRGVASYSSYTFATTFDLTRLDPSTVHLVGQFLVDNRVQEIRLNDVPIDMEPWETVQSSEFQEFRVVEMRDGFVSGVNRIEIDVVNGAVPSGAYNPMALRVEWQAFGCVAGDY